MKSVEIKIPEGYEIDTNKSTFQKIVFRKKDILEEWDKLNIEGGYIVNNSNSEVGYKRIPRDCRNIRNYRNLFAKMEQARASRALAMISQVMKKLNRDWVPNWQDDTEKYVISFWGNELTPGTAIRRREFIVFEKEEDRDFFLRYYHNLIREAEPLL